MAQVGSIYLNFSLWAAAIIPAWFVLRHIGANESSVVDDAEQSSGEISDSKESGGQVPQL